jgi:hypothetical protein
MGPHLLQHWLTVALCVFELLPRTFCHKAPILTTGLQRNLLDTVLGCRFCSLAVQGTPCPQKLPIERSPGTALAQQGSLVQTEFGPDGSHLLMRMQVAELVFVAHSLPSTPTIARMVRRRSPLGMTGSQKNTPLFHLIVGNACRHGLGE